MDNWKPYKISEFLEINPTVKLSKNENHSFVEMKDLNDGIKYVRPSQNKELKGGARFQEKDTLFARITPCLENGKICQVKDLEKGVGFGSTEFLIFRGKEGISDTDFVYYLSRSEIFRNFAEQNMVGTSGRQRVSKEVFSNLELSLPDLPTQKAIAEILSSLDDKIELNNQINQNLEALAQSIFKQWFVDFEFPNDNGEPYKSSGGEMVDSEWGEIPKGWRLAALSEIIEFNPTEKLEKGKTSSYLDMSSLPTIGSFPNLPIQREFTSGMKFRNGDTLFARITPCLENGKTAFVQFLEENEIGWGSTEFIVLRPKTYWPKEVGYLIARNENFRSFAIQNLVGTSGRQRVSNSILMNYSIPIPQNDSIAENFGIIVSELFEKIMANSFENICLKQLRDTLLPKLIAGEIDIN